MRIIANLAAALALAFASIPTFALAQNTQTPAPIHAAVSRTQAAPDPARLALAKEVVTLSKVRENAVPMINGIMQQVMSNMLTGDLAKVPAADRPKVERFVQVVQSGVGDAMKDAMPGYLDAVTEDYARIYTADELQGLAAFFRSRAGQAMIDKQIVLGQAVGVTAQRTLIPALQARMPAIVERAKATLGP